MTQELSHGNQTEQIVVSMSTEGILVAKCADLVFPDLHMDMELLMPVVTTLQLKW